MLKTKIDLPQEKRTMLVHLLNARLSDLIDLKLQTKQAHWNVRGPHFIALHELFDSIAGELEGYADDVAERVAALGGLAEGTVQTVGKHSQLTPYSVEIVKEHEHLVALSTALATTGKHVRAAIKQADELGDADTADLFTGISRGLDKKLWFVEAHLQAEG